jgi:hypothetical protein
MLNEPRRFGQFDPVIFGLRFNIDTAQTAPNKRELLPLVWQGIHSGPSKDHLNFVHSLKDEDQRFDALAYFSLRVHESRHFHDLLATPYGCMLMRQYFRALILGQAAVSDLVFNLKRLYVPVRDWVANASILQRRFPDLGPPPPSINWFAEIVSTMVSKLDHFNRGTLGPAVGLSGVDACSILEASAITVQELQIENIYGAEAKTLFHEKVLKSPVGVQYYSVQLLLQKLCHEGIPPEILLAVCFCVLCGNFQDPDPKHSRYPADLLLKLMMWLKEKGVRLSRVGSVEEVVTVVDQFFRTQGNGLMANLQAASDANLKQQESLKRDVSNIIDQGHSTDRGYSVPSRELLAGFQNFVNCYDAYSRTVFTNIRDYCSIAYCEELDEHPEPVFFIETEYGIPLTKDVDLLYYTGSGVGLDGTDSQADLDSILGSSQLSRREDGSYRVAFLLSPKQRSVARRTNSLFIDVDLWQKNFGHSDMVRFLIAGGTNNMSLTQSVFSASVLASAGVKVFNVSGEIEPLTTLLSDGGSGPPAQDVMAHLRQLKDKPS